MKRLKTLLLILLTAGLGISTALIGCGGGGGGGTTPTTTTTAQKISGVAAAGSPVIGYAYLKDKTGTTKGPSEIATDGSFSFDVTGLTAPFILFAEGTVGGQGYKLYSAAVGEGTANINPLTNLAVAAAAGVNDPATVYASPESYSSKVTSTALDSAVTYIQTMLKPLLDAYNANINPLTGTYTANHTGLDAVFDVVKVSVDTTSGNVTATDKTTNTTIASSTTTTLSSATDTVTAGEVPSTTIVTDIQAIGTMLSNFATALNKGSSLTAADLDTFYASSYGINNGYDRTQTINKWVMDMSSLNKTITSITNISLEGKSGSDYSIAFTMYFSDGSFMLSTDVDTGKIIVTQESGSWKFKGNGFKSAYTIGGWSVKEIGTDNIAKIENGIHFGMFDYGNYGLESAAITGAGLPSGGIIMKKKTGTNYFQIDSAYRNSQLEDPYLYSMNDTTISQLSDNSVYTIKVYDSSNNLVETRTKTIRKRPFMSSELTDGHFPTFRGISSHSLSAANIGGTLTFTYAKPTAYQTVWMNAKLDYGDSSWSNSAQYNKNLLFNQTSESIISVSPTTWTPVDAIFSFFTTDSYGRNIYLKWRFK
jgi:hypothetical protein